MKEAKHPEVLAAAVVGMVWFAAAEAAEWSLVENESTLKFSAVQQGSRFSGVFDDFDAQIDFDPDVPASGRIIGIVRTESVKTRDYDRDAALVDADWFDTDRYPEARFESERIERAGDNEYIAHGQLTLKGKANPVDFRFTFDGDDTAGATLNGTMTVNRFDYNVGEGWNDTSWVGQDVAVEVNLSLKR